MKPNSTLPTVNFISLSNGWIMLTEDLRVTIPDIGTIVVPSGFHSDGASIPRWAWPIIGPPIRSGHLLPAVVHDYLCNKARESGDYSRRMLADSIFFYLLKRAGIAYWKRAVMYLAVRCWGRYTYKVVAR